MSVSVQNITKTYGDQDALKNISMEVRAGEVLGFLGPNGAGKSTLMKIATCYLPPTSGRVEICGYDVVEHALDVRRKVGYLPENNPLYTDMYVKEYLAFIGSLHGYKGKILDKRIRNMIVTTGLNLEQHKKIGALSKGYRQRVGLAQALIHNPEVLILDEPTTGLDPNQIVEIRNLIKEIGKEKTVIFSTHIMPEVQEVCDRAVIIHQGKIVADNPVSELYKLQSQEKIIYVIFENEIDTTALARIEGVNRIKKTGNTSYEIRSNPDTDIRNAVFSMAASENWSLLELKMQENSLEEVFRNLTRDPEEEDIP